MFIKECAQPLINCLGAMTYAYNPILVGVSVLVAIAGAYACFDLVIRVQRTTSAKRRNWLALAALAVGGSIWAMHFIAMLAVEIPTAMQYDILITLISGLVSILMTAVALTIVATGMVNLRRIFAGGAVMGAGITAMHYVGMSGMRGNFELSYEFNWLLVSILVGVFASTLSLWLAMGLQLRGVLRRLLSAMVMGLSIAGVHYSGMYGTQFKPITELASFTQPILSPFSLGLITALVTFGILGWTLLMLLPATAAQPTHILPGNIEPDAPPTATLPMMSHSPTQSEQVLPQDITASSQSANAPTHNIEPTAQPTLLRSHEIVAPTQPLISTSLADSVTTQVVTRDDVAHVKPEQNKTDVMAFESAKTSVPTATSSDSHDDELTAGKIPVQRNKKTFFLQIVDIASISADGHYTTVRTIDGRSHFCNVGFNKLLEEIPSLALTRVHRSHAINLKSVVSFQRKRDKAIVNLGDDEHEVPVSRTHVSMLQNILGLTK